MNKDKKIKIKRLKLSELAVLNQKMKAPIKREFNKNNHPNQKN